MEKGGGRRGRGRNRWEMAQERIQKRVPAAIVGTGGGQLWPDGCHGQVSHTAHRLGWCTAHQIRDASACAQGSAAQVPFSTSSAACRQQAGGRYRSLCPIHERFPSTITVWARNINLKVYQRALPNFRYRGSSVAGCDKIVRGPCS